MATDEHFHNAGSLSETFLSFSGQFDMQWYSDPTLYSGGVMYFYKDASWLNTKGRCFIDKIRFSIDKIVIPSTQEEIAFTYLVSMFYISTSVPYLFNSSARSAVVAVKSGDQITYDNTMVYLGLGIMQPNDIALTPPQAKYICAKYITSGGCPFQWVAPTAECRLMDYGGNASHAHLVITVTGLPGPTEFPEETQEAITNPIVSFEMQGQTALKRG